MPRRGQSAKAPNAPSQLPRQCLRAWFVASIETSSVVIANGVSLKATLAEGNFMRKRLVVGAAWLALCACGGSGSGGDGGFDQALTGEWSGTRTLALQGLNPYVYPSTVQIEVSGSTGKITHVCPDGLGSISFEGSGSSAQWTRKVTCSLVRFPDCTAPGAYLDYDYGSLSLSPDKTLTVECGGFALGCSGGQRGAAVTFVGSK